MRVTASSWDSKAACLDEDPDLFFPLSKTDRAIPQYLAAKAVCSTCVVREPCLEFALRANADDGVWGGLDPEERRELLRVRRRSA